MHGENKDKVLHNRGNIFQIATYLTVVARAIFRTQPRAYGGAFLQK